MTEYIETLLVSLAAELKGSNGGAGNIDIPTVDATNTVETTLGLVYFTAGIMAVIIIIIAGILYITAGGNPEQVKRAKNAILYSIVGLVIILFAFGITSFITGGLS